MPFYPLKGTVTSITLLIFFFPSGFAVMEIIRSNGKTKRIHFRSTGASCTNTPRARTPGEPLARSSRGRGRLERGDRTIANRRGQLEQHGAGTHSALREFHCQRPPRRTSCAGSGPAPGLQPPHRKGSSARFRRCFLQGCVLFNLLGKGHLGGMRRREGRQPPGRLPARRALRGGTRGHSALR